MAEIQESMEAMVVWMCFLEALVFFAVCLAAACIIISIIQ